MEHPPFMKDFHFNSGLIQWSIEFTLGTISGDRQMVMVYTEPKSFTVYFKGGQKQFPIDCIGLSDYLRSRNFCLPFAEIDPVSENWAILEPINQPTGEPTTK